MASVLVNKLPYDFYSLEVELSQKFAGSFGLIEGFEELEYNVTINREKMYGRSRVPVKRTDGDAEYDGSITFHRYWYDYIVARARMVNVPLAKLSLTFSVSYFFDGNLVTDTLTDVALAEINNSHSRGPDNLITKVPLDIMGIYFSGVDVFGNPLGVTS